MASEVDLIVEKANATLERAREQTRKPDTMQLGRKLRRVQRFALMAVAGAVALMVAAGIWSFVIGPLGIGGVMMVTMLLVGVFVFAGLFSREADVTTRSIAAAPLPQLADQTDRWLTQQRPALPAPAQTLADSIGERLAALRPQLEALGPNTAEEHDLRRMVSEELPDLVASYRRVPANMRREDRNGRVAERELIDGMKLLDGQIDDFARSLAATDMDRLASQKRYLELRYKDGPAGE